MSTKIQNKFVQASVDFNYTVKGSKKREQLVISAGQDPNNLPGNAFFQSYLERRYPGSTVQILSVTWL